MRVKYVHKEYCIQYPIRIHAETASALYTMTGGPLPGTQYAGADRYSRFGHGRITPGGRSGGRHMENFSLYINGVLRTVCVPPQWTLLRVLRETLGLTGAKNGCSSGDCGACRVILDGTAVNACKVPIKDAAGHRVETIEGLSQNGQLHPIQQAFIDCGAVQCGFCTPGMVMSAKALLDKTLHPSDEEIREALAPNLCRCTGYYKIEEAVREAARRLEAQDR